MYMLCWGGNLKRGSWVSVGSSGVIGGVNVRMVNVWVFF